MAIESMILSNISSSATHFSCPQSFPASGSFPMNWFFASGGQSTGVQLQHQFFQWIFRVDFFYNWLVWSPCCPRDSQKSPAPQSKASILWCSAFFTVQLSHLYMTTGKTIGLTRQTFVSKVSAVEQHESTICIHIYPSSSACLFFELISFSSAYVENPLGHIFEVEICSL